MCAKKRDRTTTQAEEVHKTAKWETKCKLTREKSAHKRNDKIAKSMKRYEEKRKEIKSREKWKIFLMENEMKQIKNKNDDDDDDEKEIT